tara:strand:+ start:11908 stop:13344 length:1437 start_codon:yes stop_codon:yes gene_type:complete
MSSVVYPLDGSKDTYTLLNSSFTNKKFVKIKNFGNEPCSLDALLMAVSKEYQDALDTSKRDELTTRFRQEFKNYILAPGKDSDIELMEKIMRAYEMSSMKDKFRLKAVGEMKNIFDLVIIKKPYEGDDYLDLKISYPLFSTETRNLYMANSNLFSLLDENFLKDMIDQRYIAKSYNEKIKKLEELLDEEENMMMERELEKHKELLNFNLNRKNNLSPENMFNIIDSDFCKNEDIILRLVSCVLKFNIFLCRSWNTEISVIKRMIWDKDYNYIILFKTDTPVSLTGMTGSVVYETGGVKISQGVITVIDSSKNKVIVNDLNQIFSNDIDAYYVDKYMTYLNKLEPITSVEKIEDNYEEETSSSSSDEVSSSEEEEDMMSQEEVNKSILLDQTIMEGEEEDIRKIKSGDIYQEEDVSNAYIPSFIRSYSDMELVKLLEIFVDPSGNYKTLPRQKLELLYKNYVMNHVDDSVDDIFKKYEN